MTPRLDIELTDVRTDGSADEGPENTPLLAPASDTDHEA